MRRAGRGGLAGAVAAVVLFAGGCALQQPAPVTQEGLFERGQRELARGRPGPELAPPPGLDPQRVSPPGSDRSRLPLGEALAALAPAREVAGETVSEADRSEALKRYAAGRSLLRSGDARAAAGELSAATAIDPGAGEAWILRAEAELASGQRSAGSRSLARGVALGAGEAVHRELLAREAMERREYEEAAALLAEARALAPGAEAPELALVIDAQLGVALERLGYDTAARRLLLDVVPGLAEAAPVGRFGPLVASAIRQQAHYWTLIGDLACRLGDHAGAFEAYRQAGQAPGADGASLAGPQIYAALRAGAPSHAAAIAMSAVDEAGLVDGAAAALLSYVAGADERAGAALRRALSARVAETPVDDPARVNLAVALAALQPPAEAQRMLIEAHAASPHNPELIRAVARTAADASPADVAGLGARMVRAAPMRSAVVALALVRAHPETAALIERGLASDDAASRLFAARVLALSGRPAEGLAALRPAAEPALDRAIIVARAQLAADSGQWAEVERSIAALRSAGDPGGRWALALALAAAQRYTEALDALAPLVEDDPPAGAMIDGAWLALGLQQRALALRWLERALEQDPRNEAAHELRIRLVTQAGSREEAQRQAEEAVSELREALPASDLLELIEIGGLVAHGRLREAQELALALAEDPLRTDEALRAGVEGIWSGRSADEALLEEARAWLSERAPRRPQSPATARALAVTLVGLGRPQEAAAALREAIVRYPWPELAIALEGVLRTELGQREEADQLALQRLTGAAAGINELLSLAALRARRGELAEAAAAAARVPSGVQLTDDQSRLLLEAGRLAAVAAEQDEPDGFAHAAAVFDEAERLGLEAPAEFHERRLLMLCAWPESGPQRIAGAMRYALKRGSETEQLPMRLAAVLEEQQRASDALEVFAALAQGEEPLPAGALQAWFITVVRSGGAVDAQRMLEAARAGGAACDLVRSLWEMGSAVGAEADDLDCALFLISQLAGMWQSGERAGELVGLFRHAYELRPDAGAANDLGYTLLEERQDLDEAVRLIERAHREEPDNGAILDSIGWLRYRQGVFEDQVDEAGRIVREGAATLLERAVAADRAGSATVQDHLGDALWRIGRRAAARLAWQAARSNAERAEGGREQAQAIADKLREALRGGEPELAPVYDELAGGAGGGG